jgi:hypothetical protein
LYHVDLKSEEPIYDALSYVWGTVVYDRSFECPTGIVMITKSLDVALQRLRSPEKIQHIWADGICINQQNILERESQVKLMGLVYTQAKMVKIWLGPDTLHVAKKAFGLVEQFSLNLANYRDITMDWSPLVELSSLEYFKRIWVRGTSRH